MDELGSALRHSDEPNFRVSPFLYMPEGKLASAIRCFFFSLIVLTPLFPFFFFFLMECILTLTTWHFLEIVQSNH